MRITYLLTVLDDSDTTRSTLTQAEALAADHDVTLMVVARTLDEPDAGAPPGSGARPSVRHLIDTRDRDHPAVEGMPAETAKSLRARTSTLVPPAAATTTDRRLGALSDVVLEGALPRLDADVVVTTSPGLLAAATTLTPARVVVVHQEHRAATDRSPALELLLAHAPSADIVAVASTTVEKWVHGRLGTLAPHTVVMPDPLPTGWTPRSTLREPVVMAQGRLVLEKQFVRLIDAFGQVADRTPEWRLRIIGRGPQRFELQRQVRKWDLWDRVELPRSTPDTAAEWAKASVAALTSRVEGSPTMVREAMAAGVPVAAFDCPSGPREIVEHEVNGLLVAPQSVAGMANALLRLTTDHELRHRLGRGARHTARRYDAYALAERWVGIFTDARARRGGQGRLAARAHAPLRPPPADPTATADVAGVTPARARHAALGCAVAAARAACDTWLVVPAHEHPAPTVILPITARDAFLAALVGPTGADCPTYLSLRDPAENGWPERRGTVAGLAGDLRRGMTSVLHLEPWPIVAGAASPLGQRCGVTVEFWETSPAGELVAPRRNPYAERLPTGLETVTTQVEGHAVPTLPLLAAPTVTECRFPVDVVYTWVDGHDPEWDAARQQRLAELLGSSTAQTRESSGRARFYDRGELRYSLRSIHLFAPWVRRIHLVTAGQTPDWLDPEHPMIDLVDHRDILPTDALPTFNSHAIETALHRIEGLAEHFVYFNDDFLLGRPVPPETLFSPAGLTSVFYSPNTVGLTDAADAPPFLKAAWNNRRLLQDAFGAVLTTNLAHAPYAHRVSVLEAVQERFPEALAATARSPFRSGDDVSTLSSLAQHFGLLTGSAYVAEADLAYVNISNADLEWQLSRLTDRDQDFICLGDHHDHALREQLLESLLADFLEAYYPVAAPWERDG